MRGYRQAQYGQQPCNRAVSGTIWHLREEKNKETEKGCPRTHSHHQNHEKATQSRKDNQITRSHKIAYDVLRKTKVMERPSVWGHTFAAE